MYKNNYHKTPLGKVIIIVASNYDTILKMST